MCQHVKPNLTPLSKGFLQTQAGVWRGTRCDDTRGVSRRHLLPAGGERTLKSIPLSRKITQRAKAEGERSQRLTRSRGLADPRHS